MAIAFDNATWSSGSSVSSLTFSHTVTGSQPFLFVYTGLPTSDLITGVTYNGVAMTLLQKQMAPTGSRWMYLYYLVGPATGAHNVVVTASGSVDALDAGAISYTGVNQSLSYGVTDNYAGYVTTSASPFTSSVKTIKDNSWTVLAVFAPSNAGGTASAGTGTTFRGTAPATTIAFGDSNGVVTPAGTKTMAVSWTGASAAGFIIATISPYTDRYWVGGTGNWDASTTTNWSSTSGGSGGASVPTSESSVFFDGNSGAGTVTITATANCNNLTCTGYTGTLAGSSALNVYGSLTLVAGMTVTYTGTLSLVSTGVGNTVLTASKSLGPMVFNGSGGSWTWSDSGSPTTLTLTSGVLTLTSGTATLTGTGTVLSAASTFTVIPGTSTIKITDASSSAKTFAGGGLTYGNLWVTGAGTGAYTISGSNTFLDFKVDTPPHTINFTAGTTQKVSTFTVNGTAGNLMTLQSTSSGNPFYLKKTTSGTVSCDYLSIKDSIAS